MRALLVLVTAALAGCSGVADGGGDIVPHHDGGTSPANADGSIDLVDMARDTTSCAGGGSTCMSGNTGACNAGIVTCEGTEAMCTPNSTVQSCYDGPANTAGVGICASGTQSCVGTLGPCEGEILPAAKEDCTNDLDDDCNGIVNNTCPDGMDIGTTRLVAPYVGGNDSQIAGATNLEVLCPTNAFVTTLTIEFQDPQTQIAGLRIGCSTATLAHTGSTYTASLTAVTPAPYASLLASGGDGTGTPIVLTCPGTGLGGIWSTKATYDTGGVLGFFGECGAASLTQNADNSLSVAMTATTGTTTPAGSTSGNYSGYDYSSGSTPTVWTCSANEVVVGFNGNVSVCGTVSGNGMTVPASCLDNVQPVCAPFTPTYL